MRFIIMALILIINMLFQSTVFQYVEIMGIIPNTYLIIIISFAFMRGDIEGAVIGFAAGLLQDVFFGKYIGMNAMLGMLTGLVCGKPSEEFFRENFILPLLLTISGIFVYELLYYIFNILLLGYTDILYFIRNIILPEVVYTALISVFLYKLLYIINSWLEEKEKIRRGFF